MLNRRYLLALIAACAPRIAAGANATDGALAFIKATGDKLVAVVNGAHTQQQRIQQLTPIIDNAVDVDGVARFCLGRFWNNATPEEQKQYLQLFREVLVGSISVKLGDYRGVSFGIGRTQQQPEGVMVLTTIIRPNNPPTSLQWLVRDPSTNPKIIDLVAEGTSLRITQREDYSSFLAQHGFKIASLLDAMRHQISQIG